MSAVTKLRQLTPVTNHKPGPALDHIDALDLLNTRHQQVQGILESIFMSIGDDPAQKALKNSIWAAQDLLEQAEDAVAQLGISEQVGAANG